MNATGAPVLFESEQAALGAAIRDHESNELVTSELSQADFYSGVHQGVYKALLDLGEQGLEVNPVSVAERSGVSVADVQALIDSAQGISTGQVKTVLADLKRVGGLRVVYNAAVNASSQLTKDSKVDDVVALLEAGLYGIDRTGRDEPKDGSQVLLDVANSFFKRQAEGGGVEVSTGIQALDKAIVGLRPGKLFIVAGRPSMGKTALAGSIRRSVLSQGLGVIEFSLEMDAEELAERELAFQAQMNMRKILTAKGVTTEELDRVRQAVSRIPDGKDGGLSGMATNGIQQRWFIDDRTYNIAGIRRRAAIVHGRLARKGIRTGLVILDYIQLAGESGEGREQSISAVSRGCKFLSKQLGCTVIALSQLNRSCEYREDRRPQMSDLRESGAIEQDADCIGFVYREHVYDHSFPPESTEFIIRKHRGGPTGTVHMHFTPSTCNFSDPKIQIPMTTEDPSGKAENNGD